jgi:hypothetical protein
MKSYVALLSLLILTAAPWCVAEEPSDVVAVVKEGDKVSLREGPGGFMLAVLREGEKLERGDAFEVRSVSPKVVVLRYQPKDNTDKRRFERHLARPAIVSVVRYLTSDD